MSSRSLYFRILGYINRYRSIAAASLLCMAVAGGVDAAIMRLLKDLVDGFQKLQMMPPGTPVKAVPWQAPGSAAASAANPPAAVSGAAPAASAPAAAASAGQK